jgi:hypothetical protein
MMRLRFIVCKAKNIYVMYHLKLQQCNVDEHVRLFGVGMYKTNSTEC